MLRAQEQVEYYLSAVNLDRDDFFRSATESSPDGFIPLSTILNCNRIKQLGISADDLLLSCTHSPFLDVDTGGCQIRPKTPYRRDSRRKQKTVRMSGFPPTSTAASVFSVLSSSGKPPQNVLLQYSQNDAGERLFTGAVHALYFTETDADAALSADLYCGDRRIASERLDAYEQRVGRAVRRPARG